MSDVVTDTHGLIWHLESDPRLSPVARSIFEACDRGEISIYVPTICLVEIIYLHEKGRIPTTFRARFDVVIRAGISGLLLADLTLDVAEAISRISRITVPDMPDRIIAATALHLGLPLISKDSKIQVSGVSTIW